MAQIATTQYNIEALLKRMVLALQKINKKP
jgi:hypothetical protein